jgi:tetratricopeptide (TPR) repeat protein
MQEGLWNRVVHEAPPSLAERCENLDPDIERIVMRALEKAPANRYPDLGSMRRDIARSRTRLETADRDRLLTAAERELADGDADRALALAQEALAIDRENERANEAVARARIAVDTRLALTNARAALAAGTYDNAIAFAEQALTLDPSSSDAIALKEEAEALVETQKVRQAEQLAAERRKTLTTQVTEARRLYERRQYRDALKTIDAVLDAPAMEEAGLRDEATALCDAIEDALVGEVLDAPEPVTPHADEPSAEADDDHEIPTVMIPRRAVEQPPVRRRPIAILAIVVAAIVVFVWFLLIR